MMGAETEIVRLIAQAQKQAALLSGHLTAIEDALKCPQKCRSSYCVSQPTRLSTRRKIEADPELEAFIRARIVNQTFPAVAAAVITHFGPERRVGMSTIHRWWHRTAKHGVPPQSADPSLS